MEEVFERTAYHRHIITPHFSSGVAQTIKATT
jgi:hypothetical protein